MNRLFPPLCSILLAAMCGCGTNYTEFSIWLSVPKEEVIKYEDFGRPMIDVPSDRDVDMPPQRIVFDRGKTRTVQVVIVTRPPKYGSRYKGKVEALIETPAGISVKPDRVTIDLTKDERQGGGAVADVSLEVAASAAPGKLKLKVRPLEPPEYTHSAEVSFGVR